MFNPKTRGAETIYEKFLQPLLKQYEKLIDDSLVQIEKKGGEALNKVKSH